MFVWELVAQRLRAEGWNVWHQASREDGELTYVIHLHRPGRACRVSGPTLTEAFAEAARRAREPVPAARAESKPHFGARLVAAHRAR